MRDRGYDLGIRDGDAIPSGEAIVDVLRLLEDGAVIAGGVPAAEAALEKLRASGKYADDPSALAGVSIEGASVFSRYTGPHTTAFAWRTPILKDIAGRHSPPHPRFQRSTRRVAFQLLHLTPFNSAPTSLRADPRPSAVNVAPKTLKRWLSFPTTWGPTEWGPMPYLPSHDVLVRKMERAWGPLESYAGLCTTPGGKGSFVAGARVGNVFVGVQPALGVEGAFYLTLVPIRPRRRGGRRSLRTFFAQRLSPPTPRCLQSPTHRDAFQLHA